MTGDPIFEFDTAAGRGDGMRFAKPLAVIRADTPEAIGPAFDAIAVARQQGKWLAGFLSYELGYAFSPRLAPLMPPRPELPFLLFGVYDAPVPPLPDATPCGPLPPLQPQMSKAAYLRAFERVRGLIAAGDVYQINLTFPLTAPCHADPRALYARLKAVQPVGQGVLVQAGDFALLSRSPELFFAIDAEGRARVRPMKGTVARGPDAAADRAALEWLRASEKNRAENLMIVDLLRNDLSRIAEVGSVRVPALYQIETYATVHQMTSSVVAQLRPDIDFKTICEALFPCGSVTGAPKIRAMQIIAALEAGPRGAYCGAIGWIAPSGAMAFNVAIRTVLLRAGQALLSVGGGLVHESEGEAEWAEALSKAAFVAAPLPGCG